MYIGYICTKVKFFQKWCDFWEIKDKSEITKTAVFFAGISCVAILLSNFPDGSQRLIPSQG